jgi:hypothetical protein
MYLHKLCSDRLCGLVVRPPGYRSRGPGFDSRCCQIFWEIVVSERGPLSLVNTTEELLGRNSSGSGLENREYGRGDPLRWPRVTRCPQKLALTSPTRGGRSVGIVHLRSKAMEFVWVTTWASGFLNCKYAALTQNYLHCLFTTRNRMKTGCKHTKRFSFFLVLVRNGFLWNQIAYKNSNINILSLWLISTDRSLVKRESIVLFPGTHFFSNMLFC